MRLWVLLAALALGCTPADRAGIPVLSTVDALGVGLAHVVGWCGDRGITPETVDKARMAVASRDYETATALAADLVAAARKQGDPIPEDVEVTLRLADGLMAAHAIESFSRWTVTP